MSSRVTGKRGLYPIVDLGACDARAVDPIAFGRALVDAVPLFALQVRAKDASARRAYDVLRGLREVTRARDVPLFANDRADLAVAAEADGVHVGQDDLAPADVRRFGAATGTSLLLGFSTHDEAQLAKSAAEPIDYVALGPILATSTKRKADPTLGVTRARAMIDAQRIPSRPVVVIGGIDLEAARRLVPSVDAIAVVGTVLPDDASITARDAAIARALAIAALFDATSHPPA